MRASFKRGVMGVVWVALTVLSTGCATGPNANPKDPLEPMNRKVASFNDALDDNVLKPAAIGYVTTRRSPCKRG